MWCASLCGTAVLSKASAAPYAVHMEEIKVRHGAKARNGALVLIRYVSVVTRRGQRILAKRPGNSVVPVDNQSLLFKKNKIPLGQFNCLWQDFRQAKL